MIKKIMEYIKSVQAEMTKVSWPSRQEIVSATTLVIVFSVVFAAIVMIFDRSISKVIGLLINM